MKISDVLRNLADKIDGEEKPVADKSDQSPSDNQSDETSVFVSPLQQKIELLKKSVGVENIYDNPEQHADETEDDLEQIKKLSGISKALRQDSKDISDPA